MTQTELEKQILETIERVRGFKMNYPSELITKEQASKEIASLMEQKPDINTPFFGNSGVKIDENYLNECIEKATLRLSKIKDVDKELDEIRGVRDYKIEMPSDADIEAWADSKERRLTSYHKGLQDGAKAMRDGEIKGINKN
jgi:hypothetical protein